MSTATPDSDEPWYAVRCVIGFDNGGPSEEPGTIYEERITLWRAPSFDEAIERAEVDATQYADRVNGTYLGLAQAFHLFVEGELGDGDEVFSMMRRSSLSHGEYVNRYFDSGDEVQRRIE